MSRVLESPGMTTLTADPRRIFRSRAGTIAVIAAVALIVLAKWLLFMSGDGFGGDNSQNIEIAYNLAVFGVVSDSATAVQNGKDPLPSNYREPLPPVLLAAFIKAWTMADAPKDVSFFKIGTGAHFLRLSNIVWGLVLCSAVAAAIWTMTESPLLSVSGAGLAGLAAEINSHLTETAAAALIAVVSLFLMRAIAGNRGRDFALAGLALGALILTKGAFQYVALVVLLGLAGWLLFSAIQRGMNGGRAARNGALFVLGVLVVVTPWMARNYIYLGTPQITQRAGIVLYTRALKNEMTPEEHRGAFYVWAPRLLRGAMGVLLGFGPEDLQKGGRLQRLNRVRSDFYEQDMMAESAGRPEDAISFYRKARAERTKLKRRLEEDGVEQTGRRADGLLQSSAMSMILADPWRHLSMTPLFLWRGAAHEAAVLILVAGLALWWGRRDLFVYASPALLMIAFYALFSHNIPRYNDPAFAVLIAAVLAAGWHAAMGAAPVAASLKIPPELPGTPATAPDASFWNTRI